MCVCETAAANTDGFVWTLLFWADVHYLEIRPLSSQKRTKGRKFFL